MDSARTPPVQPRRVYVANFSFAGENVYLLLMFVDNVNESASSGTDFIYLVSKISKCLDKTSAKKKKVPHEMF